MPAYGFFDNLEVHDPAALEAYKAEVAPVVARYGGRYVVVGGPMEVVEGSWRPVFPVVIEFPTMAQARAWYHSDDYRALKARRRAAVTGNAVLIEGVGDPAATGR